VLAGQGRALATEPARLESRLNGVLIDRYTPQENASYPTLCKGRFDVNDETYYAWKSRPA
jgi:hypothetical protein